MDEDNTMPFWREGGGGGEGGKGREVINVVWYGDDGIGGHTIERL